MSLGSPIPVDNQLQVTVDRELPLKRVLRRYMDLPKYLDLIRSKRLYLTQAASFPDKFEGALTPGIRRAMNDTHTDGLAEFNADVFYKKSRHCVYLSCWSLGASDNMALWQLYGGATQAVAVTTTGEQLIRMALGWGERVEIRRVKYIDHFQNPNMAVGHLTDMFGFKHRAYSFEKEVRLVVPQVDDQWENKPRGILRDINDLNSVLRSVVVAPNADEWFVDLVRDVTTRYGVTAKVRRSKLTFLPK
jgi:hypothetical protein